MGWTEAISARLPEKSILFQLVVRNLLKRVCWHCANLANMLLVMIGGKVLAMALKWVDMPKVDPYSYSQESYTEIFCIINSYALTLLGLKA